MKYRLYTYADYDLWHDGESYYVNDIATTRKVAIPCKKKKYNIGTDHEFSAYDPTDHQLNRIVGAKLDWEGGSDDILYGNKDGSPYCQLSFERYITSSEKRDLEL